jgi:hypothetical protein
VVDHPAFKSLLRVCGPDMLLGLISDGHLDLIYQENRLGVSSRKVAGIDQHGFIVFEAPKYAAQNYVPAALEELLGKPGKARRVEKRILERLSLWKYDPARTPE